MFTYFLLLGLFDLAKAKVKLFGAKCVYNSECSQNSGLNCALEDKLFNAQRICRCSEDFSWKQNQCVNEGIELINTQLFKYVFKTCNVLPFSCTHLALWSKYLL